jgi:hypothetical protein
MPAPAARGHTGDRHVPALPKVPATRKSGQMPATPRRGGKK